MSAVVTDADKGEVKMAFHAGPPENRQLHVVDLTIMKTDDGSVNVIMRWTSDGTAYEMSGL